MSEERVLEVVIPDAPQEQVAWTDLIGADLRQAQEAAIFAADERRDEAGDLKVQSVAVDNSDPDKQRIKFSDGKKVTLTKQQVNAIRSM